NAAEEPANRRGPSRLSLKAGQWNSVKVSVVGNTATIDLNGTKIYERPLETSNDRLFSLFHYKDRTAVQVRDVVLTGDWPKALTPEQLARLTAPANPKSAPAERRAKGQLIGEKFFTQNAFHVVQEARQLPPAQRYERLLAWVVPNAEHNAFRM